jgi:hypothetical protein
MELNHKPVTERMAKRAAKESKRATLRMAERKWEAVVFNMLLAHEDDIDVSASTCSLCQRYNDVRMSNVLDSCEKCPLYKSTGYECGEHSSSFHTFENTPSAQNALVVLNDIRLISKKKLLALEDFQA